MLINVKGSPEEITKALYSTPIEFQIISRLTTIDNTSVYYLINTDEDNFLYLKLALGDSVWKR
jgi:hypothetical protein